MAGDWQLVDCQSTNTIAVNRLFVLGDSELPGSTRLSLGIRLDEAKVLECHLKASLDVQLRGHPDSEIGLAVITVPTQDSCCHFCLS